jgi:hypothetical protein
MTGAELALAPDAPLLDNWADAGHSRRGASGESASSDGRRVRRQRFQRLMGTLTNAMSVLPSTP